MEDRISPNAPLRAEDFLAVLAGAPVILFALDKKGALTFVEGKGLEALGLTREQLIGRRGVELYPDVPEMRFAEAHAIQGEAYSTILPLGKATLESRTAPLLGPNGEHLGTIGVSFDVTDRARVQRELAEWKGRYEAAVQATGQVLYEWNVETNEITFGGNPEAVLGFTLEEVNRSGFFAGLIHPEDSARVSKEVDGYRHSKRPLRLEYRVRRKDGQYVDIEASGRFAPDAEGRLVRNVGFLQDVTERKRLETQLLQAQKMESVGRLAGGVAHDFNNLLTAILGCAEFAESALPPDHPVRDDIRRIRQVGDRAATLARQLLAFARRQVIAPRAVSLNALAREIDDILRRAPGEDVRLVLRLAPDLGWVRADPSQIQQVILNLAVNARDAMPNGGRLVIQTENATLDEDQARELRTMPAGPCVRLLVSDTGAGMTPEVMSHLFEPFFTTKEPGKGTGLGLASSYGIVQQSGGAISVRSEPGRGTTFTITFPRIEPPAGEPAGRDDGESSRGTETLLLVEDECSVRGIVARMLRAHGYHVLEASCAAEAIAVASKHPEEIALLVTDVVMPRVGGVELSRDLAARRPGIKTLFMSGYAEQGAPSAALPPGAPYLQKPFTPKALARHVRGTLDTP